MTVTVLLLLAPALVLLLPLLAGRYLGERAIERIVARRRDAATGRLRAPRSRTIPRAPGSVTPHGGQLLARRLAGRAPPLALNA